jgi:hypothetical protein
MISVYVSFVVIYCTLYFFGYSLKVLLLNDDLRKFDLYITPWLGIGVIVVTLFPLSWLGYSVQSMAYYFAGAVAAANLAVWLKFREPVRVERREAIIVVSVGFAVASFYGGLLFLRGGEALAVTAASDFASYLSNARAALVSSAKYIASLPPGVPNAYTDNISLNHTFRGCVFAHALFAALFGADLTRVSYILPAFAMFLGIIAFRPFLRGDANPRAAVFLLAILVFNTFYQRMFFTAFTGQLYAFGIVTWAFFLEYYLTERGKFSPRTCVLLVFMLTLNGLNYIEASAFPLLPVAALPLSAALGGARRAGPALKNAAFSGGLYLALNLPVLIKLLGIVRDLDANPPAWRMYMPTFMDVAGAQGAVSASQDAFVALLLASNALFMAFIAFGMRREKMSSFLSASFVVYFVFHLIICAMYFRFGKASSYSAFKSALSVSFIAVIIVLRFAERKLTYGSAASRAVAALVFAAFFALNCRASYMFVRSLRVSPSSFVSSEYRAISHYARSGAYAGDFIIDMDDPLFQGVAASYAPFGRAYTSGYGGIEDGYLRVMKDSFGDGDLYISSALKRGFMQGTDAERIYGGSDFDVFRLGRNSLLLFDYAGMSRVPGKKLIEGALTPFRLVHGSRARVDFLALTERSADVSMTFRCESGGRGERATIYIDGVYLGTFEFSNGRLEAALKDIPIKPGVNSVGVDFAGDASDIMLTGLAFR